MDDDESAEYLSKQKARFAKTSQDLLDMNSLFESIKVHLTNVTEKLSTDFHQVVETNNDFKKEVRQELNEMKKFLNEQKRVLKIDKYQEVTQPDSIPSSSFPVSSTPVLGVPVQTHASITSASSVQSGSSSSSDMQAQMMLLLTESFTKLSSALQDKSDTKSDWPKFAGDGKKFRSWYLAVMAQLSLPPWLELYDSTKNDIVDSTGNVSLNGKLYSKLLLSLEGSALQSIVAKKHLRANGLALLRDLVQTYKPRNVPEIIALKTGEFWSNTKRYPSESIDAYFNRFHELLDDLSDAEEPVPIKSAIRHFIFTLGPEFEAIQSNYRIGNLPSPWNTQDWPTLLVLCRDYYNSVKPFGHSKKDATQPLPGNNTNAGFDRLNHQKKVRQWFLNPAKYCKEIEKEQEKHPNKCIFHLSPSHPTTSCNVKIECDKVRASKNPTTTTNSSNVGQLRHVTEEEFVDAAAFELNTDDVDSYANDTKEDGLLYFARITKHYLRLARVSNKLSSIPRHHMKFPVIADSGANFHMFKELEFFTKLLPATGKVILGDGKTNLSIQGVGTVRCLVDGHELFIDNVRYIPELSESIYSLFQHIQSPGHALHSSFADGLFVTYPSLTTYAEVLLNFRRKCKKKVIIWIFYLVNCEIIMIQ